MVFRNRTDSASTHTTRDTKGATADAVKGAVSPRDDIENTSSTATPTSIEGKEITTPSTITASAKKEMRRQSSSNDGSTKQANGAQAMPKQRGKVRMSFLRESLMKNRKGQPTEMNHQDDESNNISAEKENESDTLNGNDNSKVDSCAVRGSGIGSCISSSGPSRTSSNTKIVDDTKIRKNTRRHTLSFLRRFSTPKTHQSTTSSDSDDKQQKLPEKEEYNASNTQRLMQKTRVIARVSFPKNNGKTNKVQEREQGAKKNTPTNDGGDKVESLNDYSPQFECATAILQHSYLERFCGAELGAYDPAPDSTHYSNGRGGGVDDGNNNKMFNDSWQGIPEDPTVQESIECIFASQLQDGLNLWDDEDSDEDEDGEDSSSNIGRSTSKLMRSSSWSRPAASGVSSSGHIVSPAEIQQSRLNRYDRKGSASFSMKQTKKRYEQASLVYVGTFDPTVHDEEGTTMDDGDHGVGLCPTASNIPVDPLPCHCSTSFLPSIHPKSWPQAPVLLRPTPGSGTRIKCIRYSKDTHRDPIWVPGSHLSWPERIARHWGKPIPEQPHYACCERCAILPINNGNEETGRSLVIDFESDVFEGSLLLRLRHSNGTTPEPYNDSKGYFNGVNRRYQACVRGRFKKAIPFTEVVTGFRFERRCGKLPAKWILRGGLKVVSFFAPQLDAKLEGEHPHSLTPLGSTPQSISVDCYGDDESHMNMLDEKREEPVESHRTLLGESYSAPTSLQRAKLRKKAFDKLYVQQNKSLLTDPSKVYTFEFLQHLFNFQDFSIELGSMLGSVELEEILDGQPLQIMAAHGDTAVWSFDVWHECLWERAQFHHDQRAHE